MTPECRGLDPCKPGGKPSGLCALAIMTKAPRRGRVKTRLTPPLTPEEAAQLSSCFLRDTAAAVTMGAREGSAQAIAVYTPLGSETEFREILPAEVGLVAQRGEALGERLIFATEDLFALGFQAICLINSDSPTVPPQLFSHAVRILSTQEDSVVLGPSEDGGYYLIGFNRLHRALFENIQWSTSRVLQQTQEKAQERGLPVHLLPTWYDVDDATTLRRLCQELFAEKGSPPRASSAPATRAYLSKLLQGENRARIWPDDSTSP